MLVLAESVPAAAESRENLVSLSPLRTSLILRAQLPQALSHPREAATRKRRYSKVSLRLAASPQQLSR
jgi:hypothetical protein